ncbi:MAG: DinB family protein [Gemmataceae bacterium]|nr:DinB family protein [Gemmataceae bacterium]
MQAKDIVKIALTSTKDTMQMFLGDMTDAELTTRPVASANNIAWQLAHLTTAEKFLLDGELPGAKYPDVPAAIASLGTERTGKIDPPEGYLPKAQYLEWFGKMRAVTIAAVDQLADKDFDAPTKGSMAKYAPTLGELLILTANHTLMHGGQFTVTRRALDKPVVF